MNKNKKILKIAKYRLHLINTRAGKKKHYKNIKCEITEKEMCDFLEKNWSRYLFLDRVYRKNNKIKKYAVCIDRINPKKNYSIDNIRLLSFYLNAQYANRGRKQTAEERSMRSTLQKNTVLRSGQRNKMTNILLEHSLGVTIKELSIRYGVRANTISVAKHNRNKKCV